MRRGGPAQRAMRRHQHRARRPPTARQQRSVLWQIMSISYLDGSRLRRALVAGCEFVQSRRAELNRINVFPGASGQWKGPQAKTAADCVEKNLPVIKWDDTPHRYRYYMIAALASYPAPDPLSGFPEFE